MQPPSLQDFERLFKLYQRQLHDLAYNMVNDRAAAQDIVQDVFVKLWKNQHKLEFGDQIKHYLFKATTHTALNYLRSNKRLSRLEDYTQLHSLRASHGQEAASYRELEQRVQEAIDMLPPRCKAIYILSRNEGLKYQEIADTLQLSVKTVENQMGIALDKLRQSLKPFITFESWAIALLAAGWLLQWIFF